MPVVSDAQAKAIAVLARDQQPDDAIDTDAAGPMAANPRLARRIDTAAGPAWVVPADAHVCLRAMDASDPVWTCVSDHDAAAGKLLLTLRDEDGNLQAVYGVLPAGSGNARLAGPRTTAAASAPDGVIGVRTTDADSVVFTDAQGSRHTVDLP